MKTTRNMVYFILLMSSIGWGQDCNENMYWSDCGTPYECLPTCSNPYYEPDTCIEICEIGCFCNSGYVFDDESYSLCVPIENCTETSLCNEETEVELWGECYNIEETTFINLSYQEGSDYPPLYGEIPYKIGQLVNMTDLYLGGNELTVIPPEIGNLINLQSLYLYENLLTSIPTEIGNLINLTTLDIGYNQISGLPNEIYLLNNLEVLRLEQNQLTFEISPDIENLTNLKNLILSYNQLIGGIPIEVGNLINLSELNLSSNQLVGEIPPEIGNLTNLYVLDLSFNQLTGEIPSDICNLNYVFLTNNQFCPPYPECVDDYLGYQDTLECVENQLGDVNQDGILDVLDIVLGVNILLGIFEYTDEQFELLDFNQDDECNILDLVGIIDYIIGRQ